MNCAIELKDWDINNNVRLELSTLNMLRIIQNGSDQSYGTYVCQDRAGSEELRPGGREVYRRNNDWSEHGGVLTIVKPCQAVNECETSALSRTQVLVTLNLICSSPRKVKFVECGVWEKEKILLVLGLSLTPCVGLLDYRSLPFWTSGYTHISHWKNKNLVG